MILLPPYKPATFESVWDLTQTIRGVRVRYRLEWRPRAESWVITLWAAGELLFSDRLLVVDFPIGWRSRHAPPLPRGYLQLVSVAGDGSECEREGLGHTHRLYWFDPADLSQPTSIVVAVELP